MIRFHALHGLRTLATLHNTAMLDPSHSARHLHLKGGREGWVAVLFYLSLPASAAVWCVCAAFYFFGYRLIKKMIPCGATPATRCATALSAGMSWLSAVCRSPCHRCAQSALGREHLPCATFAAIARHLTLDLLEPEMQV